MPKFNPVKVLVPTVDKNGKLTRVWRNSEEVSKSIRWSRNDAPPLINLETVKDQNALLDDINAQLAESREELERTGLALAAAQEEYKVANMRNSILTDMRMRILAESVTIDSPREVLREMGMAADSSSDAHDAFVKVVSSVHPALTFGFITEGYNDFNCGIKMHKAGDRVLGAALTVARALSDKRYTPFDLEFGTLVVDAQEGAYYYVNKQISTAASDEFPEPTFSSRYESTQVKSFDQLNALFEKERDFLNRVVDEDDY